MTGMCRESKCSNKYLVTIVTIVLLLICYAGCAEEGGYLDCSSDLRLFCHTIAEINYTGEQSSSRKLAKAAQYIVMCRTNGKPLEYEQTEPLRSIEGPGDRYIFVYSSWSAADKAIQWFLQQDSVLYAEHDVLVEGCSTDDRSEFLFRSEGAELINLAGYLQLAQNFGTGSQTVAIIDSGVSTHSVLRDRMKTYGYDYIDADADPTNDLSGHGTHVAGIVADCTEGTQVWIYPVRVLNRVGSGKMSNVVAAVLESVDAGVDVINLSLESTEMSEALDDAIESAVGKGVTVVVAAGNSARNTNEVCPAHLTREGVVVVGSVEDSGAGFTRADYSNFGDSVDLYCFGSNINSCSRSGGYVVQSGTSMAAAHVSGVCALMGLTHPGLSPVSIENRLKSVCTDGQIPVLDTVGFVPRDEGFYLTNIVMDAGNELHVPTSAIPMTSHANIVWQSSDESVVCFTGSNCLQACGEGTAKITVQCLGFSDAQITVTVLNEETTSLVLPDAMRFVEEEAFMDSGGKNIVLPNGIEGIGDRAFAGCNNLQTIVFPDTLNEIGQDILDHSDQAVIICGSGSLAQAYADDHRLQYIAALK